MKIAFNPSTVAALTTPPNNKDITFDLRGQNIFARGVKFCGTDTNTWRDIKINNVSIGSNILDLRNGSNTTLTNTNGIVTINSTWRPVVDNLTSDSTTSSLSANQGRILKALIDSKLDSDHNHDDRYVRKSGDTMLGALNFANGTWNLVGNDSYMGDCNVSGHFGIKAANTTYPGIAFFNNASTFLGNLTAYNGNIKYGAYSLQFLDNGNTSVNASTWTNPFSNYNSNAVADGQAICVWGQSSYLGNLANDTGDMSLWLRRVNANVATLNMVLDGEYYANGNQRLAHISEIPTSLKNPYSLTTFGVVYDGSAAKVVSPSNFISQVSEGTSTVTDGTMFITSYASNSGFADTNAVNIPYKRKAIHLWEYIKAKTDSLYATNGHNHDDRYLKLAGGTMTGIIRATNRGGSWISGRDHCLIRSDDKTSYSYWSAILAIATVNGYWTLGHLGNGGERIGFNYDTDADYNAGRNNNHVIWLPTGGADGTLALTSDIPTSLKNPYALTISLNGTSQGPYDGSAAKNINITPGSIGAATSGHNHDNKYLKWLGNAGQSNMNAIGRISHSSGMTELRDPGNTTDNPMEGGSKSTSWHLYWQTNYTDDPSGSNAWVAQIVNRAGTDRWWVRSRSGGTITNGTNWTSNWRFLVTAPTSGLGSSSQPVYINSAGEVIAANSYPTTLPANGGNADTVDGKHASDFASAGHNHDGRYVFSHGGNQMDGASVNKNALGMTTNSGITGDWWHILQASWNSEYRWNSQIAFPTQNRNGMYYRSGLDNNTAWGAWVKLLDTNNYSSTLDSRYYTESEVNNLLAKKLNTFDFNWTNLPGKIVAGNEFNIVNAGFNGDMWFNYLPINDRSKSAIISAYYFGNGNKGLATVKASGFVKAGSSSSYVLLGDGGHKAVSDFATSTHTHGLLHSDLTVTLANTTTDSGWSMINSSYNGFLLKSIRTQGSAPNWIENNYAAGICFGGADTKGVVSIAYGTPYIKFAGGNGSKPIWWIRLRGTSGATYNLANFNADTLDGYHANGLLTALSNSNNGVSITVGGTTKSVSNISVNYANSAGNAGTLGGAPRNYGQAPFGTIPYIGNDGVMEIGRYIDFHCDNSGSYDYSTRLQASGNNRNVVTLPSASGTLALTSYGGDYSTPIFLGYLNLDHGSDGTVSSSFYCLGYSVPFTYTRGGNYCRISIPDTTRLSFYINAAIASVNYSGGGMDTWVGEHRGTGAWWLHCYASGWNEVRVKGFRQTNSNNDSWWGGNPLWSGNDGANRITVCIFGHVRYK